MGVFWQEFGVSPRAFLEDLEEWELAVGAWYLQEQSESASADSAGGPARQLTVEEARAEGLV
jgi:hypothetical protein